MASEKLRDSSVLSSTAYRAALILFCAMGCSNTTETRYAPGALRIETAQSSYQAGDTLSISLQNIGEVSVAYNLCPTFLEQHVGTEWISRGTPADLFSQTGCEPIASGLTPGGVAVLERRLPQILPPGNYRVRFEGFRTLLGPELLRPEYHVSNTFGIH
jgi:hypothetical protein